VACKPLTSASLLILLLHLSLGRHLQAADTNVTGRKIFLKQCAKCHGPTGEGVKGKFEGPLQGERPLDKLTRYIERNMPDDAPGKCTGANAAAVARYIYDAFYSREARARNHPVRVELVRLTNKQYLNTVADLLKHFTGPDPGPGPERGLSATYYNSRYFEDEKKAFQRVDPTVDFDFGDESPDAEHGTNEFSIQWRGSLLAEETGEYEFILKTPNGVRLWVNDDEEPLIDAWVSSGKDTEHRAAIRLLGNRAYPLRIDFFKFKDKTGSISLEWKPPHGALQTIPNRVLSPAYARPTFVVSTPFPPDDSSVGYERGVAVSQAWDEATTQAALEAAGFVARKLESLAHARQSDTNYAAKVESFCEEFVAVAFRRPLTGEQKSFFVSNQINKAPTLEEAVKRVVLLTLKSPRFLYLGLDGTQPDAYEVASRLSFSLWDSLPDEPLRKAAGRGELKTTDQISRQAQRMLDDPRAHAKMLLFFHHWLQMDRVEPVSKDQDVFPGFTSQIIADLRTSLNLFLEDAAWNGSSDYRTLLQADYIFMNRRLATFYGLGGAFTNKLAGDELDDEQGNARAARATPLDPEQFIKVRIEGEQRAGVLTHPYLLSAFSYQTLTSPIHRGVFLTRNIVGRSLRPPPMAMNFNDAEFAPNLTMREKVSQMTKPQACQACHSVINPLGFSLESYDAVGRFRTTENERPINPASDYVTDEGEIVHLAGPTDVANFAMHSDQAQNAFIEQLFHHVVKQPVQAYGADVLSNLRRAFADANFNIRVLLVEIARVAATAGVKQS
jgi:cytochrome c553